MVLFLNTRAAGGTALKKWRTIESAFCRRYWPVEVFDPQDIDELRLLLQQAIRSGETDLVAAGGDGTVNALLNSICTLEDSNIIASIRLGAVGLGSSNDFHKPFLREQFIDDIPCKLDFRRCSYRDVGQLSFQENGTRVRRYFLANASSGVTAEANRFFNDPTPMLAFLKRRSTSAAILFAAVRSILLYRNVECTLQFGNNDQHRTHLTNLAVMKNPYVSGSFSYDTPVLPDDGAFAINLSENMSKIELWHLLYSLSRGRFTNLDHTRSGSHPSITISSERPLAVEYDGEIVTTCSAEFTVLQKYLQVCP